MIIFNKARAYSNDESDPYSIISSISPQYKSFFLIFQNGRYVALADYCAVGNSEVNMREGDMVELLKVGCAGWWFVRVIGEKNKFCSN